VREPARALQYKAVGELEQIHDHAMTVAFFLKLEMSTVRDIL
jgi:hypothetical protein